jgi:outer membrane protein TolC
MSLRCLSYLPSLLLSLPLQAAPLTLNQVFQQASARSEPIQQAQLDIQRQEAARNEAQSLQGSRIRLDAGLDAAANKIEDRDLKTGLEPTIRTEWRHPLYDGGGREARIEATRSSQEAAQWDVVRLKEELYLQCAQLFYSIIGQERDVANLRESETIYRERIATLQQRARIGRSRRAEVLAAETQLEVIRAQLAASQQALRSAKSRLRWLIGAEASLDIQDTIDLAQLRQKTPLERKTSPPPLFDSSIGGRLLPRVSTSLLHIAGRDQTILAPRP